MFSLVVQFVFLILSDYYRILVMQFYCIGLYNVRGFIVRGCILCGVVKIVGIVVIQYIEGYIFVLLFIYEFCDIE